MCLLDFLFEDAPAMVRKTDKKQQRKVQGKQSKVAPTGLHTFTVQKAYCCPAWPIIRDAMLRYSIPVHDYSERTVTIGTDELLRIPAQEALYRDVPSACEATFSVPAAQAKWAEYLLWSTGRLIVTGGNIDKRNEKWGERREGVMPLPWDAEASIKRAVKIANKPTDGPWLEKDCKQGQVLWAEAKLNADKVRKGKRK